jgi:hypothetical protein
VGIGTADPSAPLTVRAADPTTTYSGQLALEGTLATGAINTGAGMRFIGHDGNIARDWAFIRGIKSNSTVGNTLSALSFGTRTSAGAVAERMRLDSAGLTVNGTFVSSSDRNVKQAFSAVDPQTVLEKVAAMPMQEWSYISDEGASRHIGPMAQDFRAAFGLGADDKHISMVDADGVALAAIQGLNEKLERENAALRQRLDRLEQLIGSVIQ